MLTDTERELLVDTIYGFNVYVDSLDATVSKTIANSGTWEPHMISLIATLVKPGDSILNIGSHVGLEAIIMGKIIG
jgi:protein-L-isoaspartate O-methyltransferase